MTGSGPVRLAVAACGAHWEAAALAEIEATGSVALVRRCVDVADLLATAETHRIGVALLAVDAPGLDAGVVDRLLALGVTPATVEGDGRHLGIERTIALGAIAEVHAESAVPRSSRPDDGRLVAVWGPTGAPGRSTLAVSLAAASAATGRTTALVDADPYGGSIAQLMGILDDVPLKAPWPILVGASRDDRAMTETDRAILDFEAEASWWKYPGSKEAAIRERFGLSATAYTQRLVRLLELPEAEAYRPMLVRRLRSIARRRVA